MSQVISIGIGKCGISIQEQQWLTLMEEQGIDKSGIAIPQDFDQKLEPYFNEVKSNIYKPRALLADLDDQQINKIENGSLRQFFEGVPKVYTDKGSQNLYAKGMYTIGGELIEEIQNNIQDLVEQCDMIDSFQIQHSLCGGTGSGLANLIQAKLVDLGFSLRIKNNLVLYPDTNNISKLTLEIYNTILGQQTFNESDIVIPFCNQNLEALFDDSLVLQKSKKYENINQLIAQIHPSFTCGIRYRGSLNASSMKICLNVTPYYRQKYTTVSQLPLNYFKQTQYSPSNFPELISNTLNSKYFIFNNKIPNVLASHHIIRGHDIHEGEIESQFSKYYLNKDILRACWLRNNYSVSYCNIPPKNNSKQILSIIQNRHRFSDMFRRKAFLHYYLQEGMDEMEFKEAESYCNDIISEYQPWGGVQYLDLGEEEEFDEEEEEEYQFQD